MNMVIEDPRFVISLLINETTNITAIADQDITLAEWRDFSDAVTSALYNTDRKKQLALEAREKEKTDAEDTE